MAFFYLKYLSCTVIKFCAVKILLPFGRWSVTLEKCVHASMLQKTPTA